MDAEVAELLDGDDVCAYPEVERLEYQDSGAVDIFLIRIVWLKRCWGRCGNSGGERGKRRLIGSCFWRRCWRVVR